jgi:hypothetical protein
MRWCRLYTETPSDPKLRRIARQAGTTVANVLAVWTSMLCHAAGNEGEAWGTLAGWDDLDVAINLDLDRGVIIAICREMEQRVTLDGRILKWSDRQARNDHSAERMRQWRAKRAQNQEPKPDVTSRSVTVTQSDGKKRREEKREDRATLYPPRASRASGDVPAPDWLEAEAWAEWCRYRQGRKWTKRAAELSLKKLLDLRDAGQDPRAVIEQSIANGWTGLFAVNTARPSPSQRESKMDWLIRDMMGGKPQ